MKARVILLGALLYTVVSLAISLLFLKPAKPLIGIRGEKLIAIKSFGNEIIDINITNTLLTAWVAIALLLIFWFFATRKKEDVPHGLQNFGASPACVLNLVDSAYRYDDPDHWRLPPDTDHVPFRFPP